MSHSCERWRERHSKYCRCGVLLAVSKIYLGKINQILTQPFWGYFSFSGILLLQNCVCIQTRFTRILMCRCVDLPCFFCVEVVLNSLSLPLSLHARKGRQKEEIVFWINFPNLLHILVLTFDCSWQARCYVSTFLVSKQRVEGMDKLVAEEQDGGEETKS